MELKTDDDISASNLPALMNEEATREDLRNYRHWLVWSQAAGAYIAKQKGSYTTGTGDACRFTFDQADDAMAEIDIGPPLGLRKVPAPEVVWALQATWVVLKKFERLVASGEPWSPR